MTAFCTRCSAPLPEGVKFCPACGHGRESVIACPHCHAEILADAQFCRHCGKRPHDVPPDAPEERATADPSPEDISPASEVDEAVPAGEEQEERARKRGVRLEIVFLGIFLLLALAIATYLILQPQATENATEEPTAPAIAEPPTEPAEIPAPPETIETTEASETTEVTETSETDSAVGETPADDPGVPPASEPSPPPSKARQNVPPAVASPKSPEKPVAIDSPPPSPTPARPKTCDGLTTFPSLICGTEGPDRFWKCAPDGNNWNNDIPGCQRNTGNRDRIY
ncbi:MAG: zinc-ribbon domain-containing protein [Zoogloeaceae bacterium]|jgi:RNA polymerase subunit RPABC4/transcription elongation factor Spt4|nr:zinc-ribbon domain-containing protein [Zoogloeaceae bacterium]